MTNDSLFTRRRMLQLTGGTAAVGIAGCTGTDPNDGETEPENTETSDGEDDHDEGDEDSGHDDGDSGHDDEEDGHHDDGHGHDEVGEPTDSAEVAMISTDNGDHFDPHVVRVTVGGTVTFVNESGSHDTTAYHPDNDQPQLVPDGATAWGSDLLSADGATFEHTFETEGVYHYYCTPHETAGMIGSVIVGEPDPHEQPALEDPPADKPEHVREKLEELNAMCNEALGHTH